MSKKEVYYIDGFTPRKGLLGVAAYLRELEDKDMEFTRFYMTLNGEWGQEEFWQDIVSVCYTSGAWWLLSKRGHIFSFSADNELSEEIEEAGTGPGKLGYLSRLKEIDNSLYACGLQRQVYRRESGSWILISSTIISESTICGFRDIDGISADDHHAVGRRGEIWYHDSSGWNQADSPTNKDLECILYATDKLCYICGMSGIVLRGFGENWEVIDNSDNYNLWGIAAYQGDIYLSGDKGLSVIRGNVVVPLDLGRTVQGYRLHANNEELWSIEEEEIWVFDGKKWEEIVCPDNE
jgi:hypothetical protein